MIVVKKSSKKSQYLRNCGHFLGVDYFAFPHCTTLDIKRMLVFHVLHEIFCICLCSLVHLEIAINEAHVKLRVLNKRQ